MDKLAWLEKGWYEGVLAFACEAGGKGGNEAGIDAIWKGREEAGTTAGRNAGIIGRTGWKGKWPWPMIYPTGWRNGFIKKGRHWRKEDEDEENPERNRGGGNLPGDRRRHL